MAARRALLAVVIGGAAAFAATPPASAACTDPNLDCLLIQCDPILDDHGRISPPRCH